MAMRGYIKRVYDRFAKLKSGMAQNAAAWAGQPDSPTTMQSELDALSVLDNEIERLEDALKQKVAAAHALLAQKAKDADAIAARAIGIHATEPAKLDAYAIKVGRKRGSSRPVPGKAYITGIKDDDDGMGFKVRIQKLVGAEHFEVQRGVLASTEEGTTVLEPPYPFLRTTKRLIFVDDDVRPGTRYFYRVRGVNASGPGAWSEPLGAVQ